MKLQPQVILSRNEAERCQQIGLAVRAFLNDWLGLFMAGVRWSDGVERELCMAFLEFACTTRLARDELGNDQQNVEDIQACAQELREIIERRMGS